MKQLVSITLLSILLIILNVQNSRAQTIELMAGSTLNGAVNGTLLGGATMGLTNNSDFAPMRVGLGLGTLYGVGLGAYEISETNGEPIIVSGIFNDGNNSSIIVLLDTFYGAAAGTVIVTAVLLVANEPLIEGLQYGASIGAWAGFGVGLFDAFVFADRMTASSVALTQKDRSANGLVGFNLKGGKSLGLISPTFINTIHTDKMNVSREWKPALDIVNVKFNF